MKWPPLVLIYTIFLKNTVFTNTNISPSFIYYQLVYSWQRWSRALQRDAQLWANKCRYTHAYGKWGENLFKAESPLPDDVLIERAVNEWYYEKMSWKFTPDCNEACHYTQVCHTCTNRTYYFIYHGNYVPAFIVKICGFHVHVKLDN